VRPAGAGWLVSVDESQAAQNACDHALLLAAALDAMRALASTAGTLSGGIRLGRAVFSELL
jgi:hypothetical protein